MPFHIGAALHGKSGRLVQHQHVGILVEDGIAQCLGIGCIEGHGRSGRGRRRIGKRRDTDRLACFKPLIGLGSFARDPNLPGPQKPFQHGMTEMREMPLEPAIETDFRLIVGNGNRLHSFYGRLFLHSFILGV